MNIVLLVVDSLRARALAAAGNTLLQAPFFKRLGDATVCFRRAYATECWTLPTHCSMFTGLLPSQHGAHFRSMAYNGSAPTVAEILGTAGYHTEVVTRNFVFDGTIPGITRGFAANTRLLSDVGAFNPFALFLAAAKPRYRRHLRGTGFFHPLQRDSREFLATFARAMMPADRRSLDHVLTQMAAHRRRGRRYFLFCNLYDVHAPYPPTTHSILRPFWPMRGLVENLMFPAAMSALGQHRYLRADFHLSERARQILLGRYHRAIELMDEKLAAFYDAACAAGLLDDTLLIITSDHGEGFGEHGLYLHDASVYDEHLHVPLWVHHPERHAQVVDDVVSTRDLFGLMRAVGLNEGLRRTILDGGFRAEHPVALAEHFHYPHVTGTLPQYRQDIAAAIGTSSKVIVRRDRTDVFDLSFDADERVPIPVTIDDFLSSCRRDGISARALRAAADHARRWQHAVGARGESGLASRSPVGTEYVSDDASPAPMEWRS